MNVWRDESPGLRVVDRALVIHTPWPGAEGCCEWGLRLLAHLCVVGG